MFVLYHLPSHHIFHKASSKPFSFTCILRPNTGDFDMERDIDPNCPCLIVYNTLNICHNFFLSLARVIRFCCCLEMLFMRNSIEHFA